MPGQHKRRPLPNCQEFVEFWENDRDNSFEVVFYAMWVGGGSAFALLIEPTWPLCLMLFAIAYVLLTPIVASWIYRIRYGRFTRCPTCGDSIGDDLYRIQRLTAWKGREPKWVTISKTGHCPVCGNEVIQLPDKGK